MRPASFLNSRLPAATVIRVDSDLRDLLREAADGLCILHFADSLEDAPPDGDLLVLGEEAFPQALAADAAWRVALQGTEAPVPDWADDVWDAGAPVAWLRKRVGVACRLAGTQRENAELTKELRRSTTTDPLTGLVNRTALFEMMEREWARSRRSETPLACVMIDLDAFKQVNDSLGHLAGDEAIVAVAQALHGVGRASDVVARYAGDEFCALLPECDAAGAESWGRRAVAAISGLQVAGAEAAVRLTASFGAAARGERHADAIGMLKEADAKLLAEKARRRQGKMAEAS